MHNLDIGIHFKVKSLHIPYNCQFAFFSCYFQKDVLVIVKSNKNINDIFQGKTKYIFHFFKCFEDVKKLTFHHQFQPCKNDLYYCCC